MSAIAPESFKALLDARTRALAARRAGAEPVRSTTAALIEHGSGVYAIALSGVLHVMPFDRFASVPGQHPAIIGIASYAGDLYNIADLGTLLGSAAPDEWKAEGHLILLRTALPRIALCCSRVSGIAEIVTVAGTTEGAPLAAGYARALGADAAAAPITVIDIPKLVLQLQSQAMEIVS